MESIQKSQARLQANTNLQTARALIRKANTSNQPISLEKNEIIRGLVTDLRPGFVTIKLANRQTVNAELEGTNEVSIGDVAPFKILENDGGKITLKKLNTTTSAEDATIIKALEEAELPINDVNHQIVKELLYHKLPISKEMINQILIKSEQYPNADIDTLVYLIKKGINLNESYLAKFDEYKHFDHRLMQHIDQIGTELDSLIKLAASKEGSVNFLNLASSVFEFLEIEPKDIAPIIEETPMEEVIEEVSDEIVEHQEDTLSSIHGENENDVMLALSGRETKQLLKLFSSVDLPSDYIDSLKSGTASLRETVQHITESISFVSEHAPEEIINFKTPLVFDILEQFHNFQSENEELASILTTRERKELLDAMEQLPLSIKDAALIANGEMTQSDFTSLLASYIQPEYEQSIRAVFGKNSFSKLMSGAMEKIFSLTPEKLSENPNSVTDFYNSLVDKMEDLRKMTEITSHNLNNPALGEKMDGLKQNLNFMQDFNKLFTYIQLPVRLKEQVTHGDLYVYTNKKKLQSGTKDISVLLHLDMDNLGPLDIHLSLAHKTVSSKFYVSDKETKQLLQKHSNDLTRALAEKGFLMKSEFFEQQKEVNIIKDLVDQEVAASPIKRYSFDIRA